MILDLKRIPTAELEAELIRRGVITRPDFVAFALRTDWGYEIIDEKDKVLQPGEEWILLDVEEAGWITAFYLRTDNPYILYRAVLTTPIGPFEFSGAINIAYEAGLTQAHPGIGYWISKYDTINNIYVVNATPTWPGLAYHGKIAMSIKNISTTTAIIKRVIIGRLKFI